MAVTRKVKYSFSSALTALKPESGEFDEDEFRRAILPIRGRIMSLDGLAGCFITRYAVVVDYLDNILDENEVEAHLKKAFQWAEFEEGFFPFLKGNEKHGHIPLVLEKVSS